MSERTEGLPGNAGENRSAFTAQAQSFGQSTVLAAPGQINPVLEMAQIQPEDRILDVGCGTGFLLIAAAGKAGQAVGVDVTPAMLAEAKRRCEAESLSNVTLREATAEALPFADERFDVVMTRLTLHHVADPRRVLSEMFRVCRPGGRAVVCDIVSSEDPQRADLHNRLERLRDPAHVRHYPGPEFIRMVEEAGFIVEETRTWETERTFAEWVQVAAVRPEVIPALKALLEACAANDAAGIDAHSAEDGTLRFKHHWVVVAGRKPNL